MEMKQNKNTNTNKSVMEKWRKNEGKKAYGDEMRVDTPLGVWFPPIWV